MLEEGQVERGDKRMEEEEKEGKGGREDEEDSYPRLLSIFHRETERKEEKVREKRKFL